MTRVTVFNKLLILMVWSGIAGTGLVLSVLFTNPVTIGPIGVTLWFVILFTGFGAAFSLAFYMAKTFLHLHVANVNRLRYAGRQGLLVSAWVTGLLALSSLRQLSLLDAILLALFLVIVEIYVRFRWP